MGAGIPNSKAVEVFQITNDPDSKVIRSSKICRKRRELQFEGDYGGLAHPVAAMVDEETIIMCGGSQSYQVRFYEG